VSLVLKQRGLTTQSAGVQNTGTPGDLGAVEGSFTRRPYGPSLAGWPMGWSAHNSNVDARHTWPISLGSGEDVKALMCATFHFGPGVVTGNGECEPLAFTNSYGTNEVEWLQIHVATMSMDLLSLNGRFATASGIKVVRRNWPVWIGLAAERLDAINTDTWVMKVLYQEVGGILQTLHTTANYTLPGTKVMTGARGGLYGNIAGSGSKIAGRYGLPSLYQMTAGMADAAYPSEINPPTRSLF
jgi:hypothetical protein